MMNKFACLAMDVISGWDDANGCISPLVYKAEADQTCNKFLDADKNGYSMRACKTISASGKACY